jgi:hypothetical protein
MTISPTDRRLTAAKLSSEEFVGDVKICGDASPGDEFLEAHPYEIWEHLPEHVLLRPVDGYSLRALVPHSSHAVFLIHDETLVGIFTESDVLVLHGDHQGKGLGQELVLLAFAQKPWRNIQARKVSNAGNRTLHRAYKLARACQQAVQGPTSPPSGGTRP